MPHNPIKEVKISFHDATGMTPKPTPLPQGTPNQGEGAMQREPAPQSQLDPLKEVLFKSWATAQGVQDPDAPDNHMDLRGMYNKTNGQLHPPGTLTGHQDTINRVLSAPPTQPLQTPQAGLQAPPMGGPLFGLSAGPIPGQAQPDPLGGADPLSQLRQLLSGR